MYLVPNSQSVKTSQIVRFSLAFALFSWVGISLAHAQQPTAPTLENPPPQANSLESFVAQIVQSAESAGCHPGNCKVLVADFAYPEGASTRIGHELADVLSEELSKGEQPFPVVDRSIFQSFILKEGLPSRFQNQPGVSLACWIARELKANAVIVGKIDKMEEPSIKLTARFLNVDERKHTELGRGAQLLVQTSLDLSSVNSVPHASTLSEPVASGAIYHAGVQGVSIPKCSHMPAPPLTEDARSSHFAGIVLVEALLRTNGAIVPLQILKAAPHGLNESSFKTLEKWKCEPATLDGRPVPALVPFEINFVAN
jgi:hypothetical protein